MSVDDGATNKDLGLGHDGDEREVGGAKDGGENQIIAGWEDNSRICVDSLYSAKKLRELSRANALDGRQMNVGHQCTHATRASLSLCVQGWGRCVQAHDVGTAVELASFRQQQQQQLAVCRCVPVELAR